MKMSWNKKRLTSQMWKTKVRWNSIRKISWKRRRKGTRLEKKGRGRENEQERQLQRSYIQEQREEKHEKEKKDTRKIK